MLRRLLLAGLPATLLTGRAAPAASLPAAIDRAAPSAPRPEQAMLLAITQAGDRLVAVGARGRIVLSDDGGVVWRQAAVPTSVTLTAVAFRSASEAWAVGHMGVILHTSDGGSTWSRQMDGSMLATAQLAAAERQDKVTFSGSQDAARMLIADGPDKPFLAVSVLPEGSVVAAGGFGMAARLDPARGVWAPASGKFDDESQSHVYGISVGNGRAYAAGEQGLFLRLMGQRFVSVPTPWSGTFFGALAGPNGVFAYGLRGTLLHSTDFGSTWRQLEVATTASLTCGAVLADGTAVFGTSTGQLVHALVDGLTARVSSARFPQPVTGIVDLVGPDLVLVGPRGVGRLPRSAVQGAA